MKLKNILIVVKDIEKSKQFYHDLFGLEMVLDNNGNMILTEGLVLQDEKIWKKFLEKDIIPKSNSCELYFEEQDIEAFIPAKQRAKRELARIWRLPRGSNTPPLWGELAKKKLSHAPLLAAGYLTEKLDKTYPSIQYVNRLMTHSWGQKVIRFYDLDGNLIEVGTPM
jgi:catechol 2,3-dioxygenase-like lactoylglutathione lyase family enzyme